MMSCWKKRRKFNRGSHAILSASSSKRWLNCPPSAKLCAEVEDTTSEYAKEGTDAHTLCEYKVKSMLGIKMQDPTDSLSYYNEEMERCANDYASYVMEVIEDAKNYCKDPLVLIEQRLDFSRFVPFTSVLNKIPFTRNNCIKCIGFGIVIT